jgi:hypothetical protein
MSEVRLAICDRGGVIAEVARFASSPAFRVSRADADTESGDLLERQSNNAALSEYDRIMCVRTKIKNGPSFFCSWYTCRLCVVASKSPWLCLLKLFYWPLSAISFSTSIDLFDESIISDNSQNLTAVRLPTTMTDRYPGACAGSTE